MSASYLEFSRFETKSTNSGVICFFGDGVPDMRIGNLLETQNQINIQGHSISNLDL